MFIYGYQRIFFGKTAFSDLTYPRIQTLSKVLSTCQVFFIYMCHLCKLPSHLCRDEVNRLMQIINSQASELPNVEKEEKYESTAARGEDKAVAASHEIINTLSDRNQRELHGSIWKTSTPLPQSVVSFTINFFPYY